MAIYNKRDGANLTHVSPASNVGYMDNMDFLPISREGGGRMGRYGMMHGGMMREGKYQGGGDINVKRKGANVEVLSNKAMVDQAFNQINPAKDTLDVALMSKYPNLDLDALKTGATNVYNPDLDAYIQKTSPGNRYLTRPEMQQALGQGGYENYIKNTNIARSIFDTGNVTGTGSKESTAEPLYGKRSSLYKYQTPMVEGKPKPYRMSEELSHIKLEKGGGLTGKDRRVKGKSKDYPMVSSGDFAGGDRSYPIPTKEDAVDALRLAGMHGRSDVRAKVYSKYPSLKKKSR